MANDTLCVTFQSDINININGHCNRLLLRLSPLGNTNSDLMLQETHLTGMLPENCGVVTSDLQLHFPKYLRFQGICRAPAYNIIYLREALKEIHILKRKHRR